MNFCLSTADDNFCDIYRCLSLLPQHLQSSLSLFYVALRTSALASVNTHFTCALPLCSTAWQSGTGRNSALHDVQQEGEWELGREKGEMGGEREESKEEREREKEEGKQEGKGKEGGTTEK